VLQIFKAIYIDSKNYRAKNMNRKQETIKYDMRVLKLTHNILKVQWMVILKTRTAERESVTWKTVQHVTPPVTGR
jgi:hypothetical protein